MPRLREWTMRLWGTLSRRRDDADLEAELRSHLELADEVSGRESRATRGRGVPQAMDALRDQRAIPWLEDLSSDARHGLRLLLADPVFTTVAVLSLALGIGLNGAIFSLTDALILRPLPIADPARVMTVSADASEEWFSSGGVSYPNYRDLHDNARSFDALVAYRVSTVAFAPAAEATREMRMGMLVSDNFFAGLGVQPSLGRTFTPDEAAVSGRAAAVVLSDDFWRADFKADPSVLGRSVWLNGVECHVVGIAPPGFSGVEPPLRPAFYAPAVIAPRLGVVPPDLLLNRETRSFSVKGRLRVGVSAATAQAELRTLWTALAQEYPKANAHRTPAVRTELEQRIRSDPWDAAIMAIFIALAILVLIIACANVANLMLGRVRARSREIAMRLALGVSRSRLLRQLLTEGLLLGTLGCAVGVVFAYGGIRFFQTIPTGPQISIVPQLDARVLGFSVLVAMVSAVLCSVLPARLSIRTDLVAALKTSELTRRQPGRRIGRNALVIAQVAAATVVLVATGMMVDGFRKALTLDPGFRTDHLAMMTLDPALIRYPLDRTRTFYRDLLDRARNLPGVQSATITSAVPFVIGEQDTADVIPEGYRFPPGQESESTFAAVVDEHFFDTMRIAVIRGRAFTTADTATSQGVAIVNEQFASRFWPGQDPIGKRIRLVRQPDAWWTVVGLTRTAKYVWVAEAPTPFVYLAFSQQPRTRMSLLVLTTGDAADLVAPMRALVASLDVNQPVANAQPFGQIYRERAIVVPRIIVQTVAAIGLLALALALVGVYGLVAYSVSRRTREIGIRMAIGAAKSDVLSMVLRQGLWLAGLGIAFGGLVSILVARFMAAALVGVGAPNPATYVVVPLLLIAMTALASYVPGRRAARVDPLVALRYE